MEAARRPATSAPAFEIRRVSATSAPRIVGKAEVVALLGLDPVASLRRREQPLVRLLRVRPAYTQRDWAISPDPPPANASSTWPDRLAFFFR